MKLKVITTDSMKNVRAYEWNHNAIAIFFEYERSPYEQMAKIDDEVKYIKEHNLWHPDEEPFTALWFTFSPYVLNYLNVLIAKGELNKDNLQVIALSRNEEGKLVEQDLLGTDEKGNLIVDTYDLSEPMERIFNMYKEALNKKN